MNNQFVFFFKLIFKDYSIDVFSRIVETDEAARVAMNADSFSARLGKKSECLLGCRN